MHGALLTASQNPKLKQLRKHLVPPCCIIDSACDSLPQGMVRMLNVLIGTRERTSWCQGARTTSSPSNYGTQRLGRVCPLCKGSPSYRAYYYSLCLWKGGRESIEQGIYSYRRKLFFFADMLTKRLSRQ